MELYRKWVNFICISLFFLASSSFALNAIYDVKYNNGPEIFTPDDGALGGGLYSYLNSDLAIPGLFKFGLNERFEIGSRLTLFTQEKFKTAQLMLDIGTKVKLASYDAFQVDILMGINNDNGSGVALTYTTVRSYNKHISAFYEGRVGFFDALTGAEGIMMVQLGAYPQLHIAKSARLQLGVVQSTSLGHFKDAFNFDLIPSFIFQATSDIQVNIQLVAPIIGNTDDIRFGVYATTKI